MKSADSPLPLDLRAAMTTGSDGQCRKVACWFLIQKRNGLLAPGKHWRADRPRSQKWQENLEICIFTQERTFIYFLAGGGEEKKLRPFFFKYPLVKGGDIKDKSTR